MTDDLDHQVQRNKQTHADYVTLEKEMKLKHMEVGRLKTDKDALERRLDKVRA